MDYSFESMPAARRTTGQVLTTFLCGKKSTETSKEKAYTEQLAGVERYIWLPNPDECGRVCEALSLLWFIKSGAEKVHGCHPRRIQFTFS